MRPEPQTYEDLIASLADGTPVDWAGLEAGVNDEQKRRRYQNLRLVARVADLHRTLSQDDSGIALDVAATEPEIHDETWTWGHLEVRGRLASGAFGSLYRAHDPRLDRDVALKLLRRPLDETTTARLLSEARALARVSHPNVVIIHGADVFDRRAGLWMELISGETLAAIMLTRGRFGAGEAASVGRDLCRALVAVHAAGLVHNDIKAQNVMRETGGRIVLMDFGAGRALGTEASVAGTPLYLAPEVLAGAPPTAQSDIYSLGVLLFFLLTDTYPHSAADIDTLRQMHADGSRTHLRDLRPDLPHALVDCIERALESDPALRFSTGGAMERALAKVQASDRRWWSVAAIGAAIVTTLAAGIVVVVSRATHHEPIRSIAVLPFGSARPETAHLIAGLSTDVVRELQRFDVQVQNATDAGVLMGSADIDRRLASDAILSADARSGPAETTLHVAVRRAQAAPFWSHDYAVPDAELPAIARTVAGDVARAVGSSLRAEAPPPFHQTNYRAYDAYERGRILAERRTEADLMRSLEYFTEATKLDSAYAEPWAGMADAYSSLGVPPFGDLRPMDARRLAKEAALKALALNPNLAEAHTSLAWSAELYDWDWTAAESRFKQAIALNPQYALAHHWYAMYLTDMGRFDEARGELQVAQSLDPLSLLIHRDFGWIEFCRPNYPDAIARLRETLSRDPKYTAAITLLARSLAGNRQYNEALAEVERARTDISNGSYLSYRAYIEAAAGDPHARATLTELRSVAQHEYVTPYYFALIYTALGQTDNAVAELERAHNEQDATLGSVNVDPRFEPIRSDPRFQAIIRAMRFPTPR